MKRIALLLLCVLIVLSSVSCGRWYTADVDHEGNPILLGRDKLPDRKACEDAVNAVVELLKNGGTSVEMTKAVDALYEVYGEIEEEYVSSFLKYCLRMYDEADEAGKYHREVAALYDELYADIAALMAASRGTEYEELFFAGYTEEEIAPFYGDERFPNAICQPRAPQRPDRMVVCAMDGEEIMGMAGCSEDAPGWLQIGIDVMPAYRSRGVGTYLTTLLKNRILETGGIPFYGTSISNYHSWNIALNSGFRPAWVEIGATKRSG